LCGCQIDKPGRTRRKRRRRIRTCRSVVSRRAEVRPHQTADLAGVWSRREWSGAREEALATQTVHRASTATSPPSWLLKEEENLRQGLVGLVRDTI
jgi:hypothetical protein